jgi:hypothetical protein
MKKSLTQEYCDGSSLGWLGSCKSEDSTAFQVQRDQEDSAKAFGKEKSDRHEN